MLSDTALKALQKAAENPIISLCNHPNMEQSAIEELEPLGLVEPDGDNRHWFQVTAAGFEFALEAGMDCSWWFVIQSIKVAA